MTSKQLENDHHDDSSSSGLSTDSSDSENEMTNKLRRFLKIKTRKNLQVHQKASQNGALRKRPYPLQQK